jgi:putative flippase GtrA
MNALRGAAVEGLRYVGASALALAIDVGVYSGLIRLAGVDYLVAAPIGFAVGLVAIYAMSVRWVFLQRRIADRRVEFALFIVLSLVGMALNQLIVYAGVEFLDLPFELAKLPSAGAVFCFNYVTRKLLLFTHFG